MGSPRSDPTVESRSSRRVGGGGKSSVLLPPDPKNRGYGTMDISKLSVNPLVFLVDPKKITPNRPNLWINRWIFIHTKLGKIPQDQQLPT